MAKDDTDLKHRPLTGLRIVDLSDGADGAIGRILSDLGADVVMIEPKGGSEARRRGRIVNGQSIEFAINAFGKRSITADLASADGREKLNDLLAEADILIAGKGAPETIDLDEMAARLPALVILSVTDFGLDNTLSNWSGSDAVYQAIGSQLARSGAPDCPPLLAPGRIAEQSAMVQATFGVLLAYLNRLKTGRGDMLDFAAAIGAAQALDPGFGMQGSATSGVPAHKLPRGRPDEAFRYPILPCKDGHVRACVLATRQWRSMFEWMGSPEEFAAPEFNSLQNRYKSPELLPAMEAFFADKTRAQIEREAQDRAIPVVGVVGLSTALTNEQSKARDTFKPAQFASGVTAPIADGTVSINGARAGAAGPVPPLENRPDVSWRPRRDFGAPDWADTNSPRPLAGLRVLDMGVIVVGAEQGRLLADQGADVIKIENPAFPDGSRQTRDKSLMSPTFASGHRNKRSLSINLKSDEGLAILFDLVAEADVLLSNFKPGTLDGLGLSEEKLRAANPRLVMSDSSAFGAGGPWSSKLGYGPLVRAAAGLTQLWRYDDDPQSYSDALTVYPDHVAGRMGVIGVMALLIQRARSGEGGRVSGSQMEVMLSHLTADIAEMALRDQGVEIANTRPELTRAVVPCAGDDEWCVVDPQTPQEYQALLTVLDYTDNGPDTGADSAHDALNAWAATRSPVDAAAALQAAGVPAAPMLRVFDMPEFAYYQERDFFSPLTHPELPVDYQTENAPILSRHMPDPDTRPAPVMGQQSREVVADWLNLEQSEIERLEKAEIIGGCVAL